MLGAIGFDGGVTTTVTGGGIAAGIGLIGADGTSFVGGGVGTCAAAGVGCDFDMGATTFGFPAPIFLVLPWIANASPIQHNMNPAIHAP